MITDYLELVKMEKWEYEPKYWSIDILELIENLAKWIGESFKWWKIIIEIDSSKNIKIDNEDFAIIWEQKWVINLFANIIKNATEHSNEWENVTIKLSQSDNTVEIEVYNKQVIAKEIRNRLFEKHATYWKAYWTWLWLYSSKLVAESHWWSIEVETSEEVWTTVIIRLNKMWKLR